MANEKITIQYAVRTLRTTTFKEKTFASADALNKWLEKALEQGKDIEVLRYEQGAR
jgi:hypothetical protein